MSRDDEFVRETRASVRQLTNGLVELERSGGSRELVDELFRTAHSLKGNCSMAGLDGASRLAHAVEDFLSSLRDGSLTPNPDLIDAALAAVDDIDDILKEWHDQSVTTDPEPSASALRAEMDRYRDESTGGPGWAASTDSPEEPNAPPDDPSEEFDQTVVDALESASGFDDLDRLLADMDDPDETDPDEQSRWGTFDERESSQPTDDDDGEQATDDDGDATPSDDDGDAPGPTRDIQPQSSGAMDEFASIKNDVQTDDVSALDRELVDVEFGEFDHDDELSIQDLIEGEIDDSALPEEDADADDDTTERPPSSTADTETLAPDDAIRPEDFGYESTVPSTPDDTPTAGEGETAEADGVTAAGADAQNPFEGGDLVDPADRTTASDVSTADTSAESDTSEPDISFPDGKTFGPEPDDGDASAESSAEETPTAESPAEETPVAEPTTEETPTAEAPAEEAPAEEPATEETPTEATSPEATPTEETPTETTPAEETEPETSPADTPEFPETFAEDDDGPEGVAEGDVPDEFGVGDIDFSTGDDEVSEEFASDDIDISGEDFSDDFPTADADADSATGARADEDDVESDFPGTFDADSDTEPFGDDPDAEPFGDELDLPEDFLSGSLDVGGEGHPADEESAESGDIDVASESSVDDLGPTDVDLPDVDELTAGGLTDDTDAGATDVSFERDEHTMAFESRFAERFGGSTDDDKVQLVQTASATIEASSLDTARYQSSGTADYPLDFGETRESDRIQSLTVDVENADSLLNLVEELSLTQLRIKQSDDDDIDDHLSVMDSVTGELRRAVMNLRLMPLSTAIDGLPRVVRDIARTQDKEVAYEVSDEGVDLDRSIVEKLGDPLVHLVRNAVDHGIEPPDERERLDKPREGTVELRAWRDRERVVIEVEDDGRGLSAERIRQQAIDNDIISRERAERMSFDEVYELVFEPGFTTADEVTDVSGRGVGMDAVRRTVNSLDGTVDIESEPGSGTTVRLRLPVSVAVSKMLFVGVGPEQYAIPASAVADVELVDEADLDDDGTVAVEWPEEVSDRPARIPYRRLSDALGVETGTDVTETGDAGGPTSGLDSEAVAGGSDASGVPEGKRVLVRLEPETREFALVCDEVDDAREVVVKPYEKLLGDVPGISGATMSGDGTLVNIIDVTTL
ncbi:ATP-binding protein [Haloferax sp. YSSS75]|uniref:ATP-binding protein n=1 Tax=Haloferax sp. YSSS75 TaxID=3388564 RepID=UPI00398D51BE